MPGPDPNFPDQWTNFFDMLDSMRVWTSTTSNHLDRFDPLPMSIGFYCVTTNDKWYCLISDVASTLQLGPDAPDDQAIRAKLVSKWLLPDGYADLMSFINYYG